MEEFGNQAQSQGRSLDFKLSPKTHPAQNDIQFSTSPLEYFGSVRNVKMVDFILNTREFQSYFRTDMTGNYVFEEKDFDLALDRAIKSNHADVFVRLKPFMASAHYEIYVTTAAKNGDLEFMKTFFSNPREEFLMTDRSGNNPIHNAAITGQIEIVKYFLENTKGLTASNEYRKTPLFYAVINGHLEIVKILMPNPKQKFFKSIGTNRNNLIHIAACKGQIEIVKYFLGNTEELVAVNKYGDTPL